MEPAAVRTFSAAGAAAAGPDWLGERVSQRQTQVGRRPDMARRATGASRDAAGTRRLATLTACRPGRGRSATVGTSAPLGRDGRPFETDAREISALYALPASLAMPHMQATGVSGVDLYAQDSQENGVG